jgi:pimeloyl-ACP methyl ester carboxylesterase
MMPIVFVHGFACTHTDWRMQVEFFSAAGRKTFAPDLRGHGATHARPEDCSIETYGSDIAALLEGKDLSGAVLIGHSMGCRVVLQAFLNAPHRVAALALIDGSYRGGGGDPLAAEQAGRAAIAADGYLEFQRRLFDGMFLAPSALSQAIVERAMRLPEAVGATLHPRIARWDTANMQTALAAVRVPLLVIQTTSVMAGGKRVPLHAGESSPWLDLVRRQAPQAQIEIIPGMGHFPQLEAPQTVNKYLAGLIDA